MNSQFVLTFLRLHDQATQFFFVAPEVIQMLNLKPLNVPVTAAVALPMKRSSLPVTAPISPPH
jgi:hypothetical protein